MVSLYLNGKPADMPLGQAVTLYKGAGLLDFSALEPTLSAPFSLPDTGANRKMAGHLHRPASTAGFIPIPATLEYQRSLIASGEFLLSSAQERKPLEGFFRADAGTLSRNKDRLVGEILEARTLTLTSSSLNDPAYTARDADVVLPQMVWRRKNRYLQSLEEEMLVNHPKTAPYIAPCFKLTHLLEALFNELGYTVYLSVEDSLLGKAILFGEKAFQFNQSGAVWTPSYAGLLPEITLSGFIRSCRTMGFAIGINSQFREVQIQSLDAVFGSEAEDWTAQAEPHPKITPAYGEGSSKLEYPEAPEDKPMREVDTVFQLGSGEVGDTVLVREEGRLYTLTQFGIEGTEYTEWMQSGLATQPYILGKDGFDGKSDFIPCPNAEVFHLQGSEVKIRESNGKTLIRPIPRNFNPNFQVQIQDKELGERWYAHTGGTIAGTTEIPLPYQEDLDGVEIAYRLFLFRQMPDRTADLEGKPLISVYHGTKDGYAFASPQGLRWEELAGNQLAKLREVVERGKQATFTVRPKPSQVAAFSPLKPIQIDGVRYIPKSLKLKLGRQAVGELEGWMV